MGKFIVLEGCDGVGKTTMLRLAKSLLRKEGKKVALMKFPALDAHKTGSAMRDALQRPGEEGYKALLFACNRYEMKSKLIQAIEENDIVLADRYIYSGAAYTEPTHWAKPAKISERMPFLELEVLGMPKPDQVFLLGGAPLIDKENSGSYGIDIYEQDHKAQAGAYFNYRALAMEQSDQWQILDTHANNKRKSRQKLAQEFVDLIGKGIWI